MGGIILVLIGAYFMLGGISWLPASSQALVWPVALIVIGVFFLIKTRKRARWRDAYMRHHRQWMNGSDGQAHRTTDETQQQCESEDGFLRSNNTFGAVRHVVLDELFKELTFGRLSEALPSTCAIRILHPEKLISTWIAIGAE